MLFFYSFTLLQSIHYMDERLTFIRYQKITETETKELEHLALKCINECHYRIIISSAIKIVLVITLCRS